MSASQRSSGSGAAPFPADAPPPGGVPLYPGVPPSVGAGKPTGRPLRIIFLVVLMDLVGFGLVLPLLPLYAQTLGGGPTFIGAFLGIYSLMAFLFSPVWGRLSDKLGRRPIILLSLAGSVVAYVTYGLAERLSADHTTVLGLLFGSRLLAGITAANIATAQAYVADVTAPAERARGMGVVGAAIGLGFVLGPALGAVFTSAAMRSRWGLGATDLAAAAICAANLVWAWWALPESLGLALRVAARQGPRPSLRAAFRGRAPLLLVICGLLLTHLGFSQFEATFALMGSALLQLSPADLGLVFSYLGVIVVVMQGWVTRRLVARLGERATLVAGASAMAAGLAGVALSQNALEALLALGLMGAGFGATQPSLLALASLLAPPDRQGLVLGVAQSMSSLARIAGPSLGLALYAGIAMRSPYWAAALLLAGVAAIGTYLVQANLPLHKTEAEPRPGSP